MLCTETATTSGSSCSRLSQGCHISKFIETTWEASPTFIIGKFDGILGLEFPEISFGFGRKLVAKEIFSFWLNRDPDAKPQKVCSQIGLRVFDGSHSVSKQIETVVEKEKRGFDLLYTACEMAVVWIQNWLRQNQTKELILQYVNQVRNQLCEHLPSPNGESAIDCHQILEMPSLAFAIANKTFTLTPEQQLLHKEHRSPRQELQPERGHDGDVRLRTREHRASWPLEGARCRP